MHPSPGGLILAYMRSPEEAARFVTLMEKKQKRVVDYDE